MTIAELNPFGEIYDAAVIGGGLAGLNAARELMHHNVDNVVVLEAQEKVGGRVADDPNYHTELGANWFAASQPAINSLIDALGIEKFRTYNSGCHVWNSTGKIKRFTGAMPYLGVLVSIDLLRGFRALRKLSEQVDVVNPLNTPNAAELDNTTLGIWIEQTLRTKVGRKFFSLAAEVIFSAPAGSLSLLYVLAYSRSSNSFDSLISVHEGHQEFRVKGGTESLVRALRNDLDAQVLTGYPVASIGQDQDYLTLKSDRLCSPNHVRAKRVIVAVPPACAVRIQFEPGLDVGRAKYLQSVPQGHIVKVLLFFERPFWRDYGYSGQIMGAGDPFAYCIDDSPEDGAFGALAMFIGPTAVHEMLPLDPSRVRQQAVNFINVSFGVESPQPVDVCVKDWADNRWVGGAYGGYCPPGVISRYRKHLSADNDPIFWAGAEYAHEHMCQMEGALQTGAQAAALCAASLHRDEKGPVETAEPHTKRMNIS